MLADRDFRDLSPLAQLLTGLALAFGALSTFATAFAFVWFVKIKRSFRHDLIMLLVQGDFIKSVVFVFFPIVQLARGPIASNSPFCQFTGFVLSVGTEASDVAVLLIAIHSAMYIRHPRSGLYPYRWVAYVAYVVVPILLASLAFADGGYGDLGAYCYLYTDRGWSRLALSWVPRYVLIAFLLVIYLWIYIYISVRVNHYGRRDSTQQTSTSSSSRRPSAIWGRCEKLRRVPSTSSLSGQSTTPAVQQTAAPERPPIQWKIPFYSGTSAEGHHEEELSDDQSPPMMLGPTQANLLAGRRATRGSSTTFVGSTTKSPNPGTAKSTHKPASEGMVDDAAATAAPAASRPSSPDEPGPSGHMSLRQALAMTRYETQHGTNVDLTATADTPYRPNEEMDSDVARNRERIRWQLRSLIVYPLIYILTWLFPLINQAFGQARVKKPVWLLCLSIISFSVQGFANAVVFTAREKPWRHKGRKGFWLGMRGKLFGGSVADRGMGRTRDEMMVDARNARARRAEEMIDETRMTTAMTPKHERPEYRTRDWWETSVLDKETSREDEEQRRNSLGGDGEAQSSEGDSRPG